MARLKSLLPEATVQDVDALVAKLAADLDVSTRTVERYLKEMGINLRDGETA